MMDTFRFRSKARFVAFVDLVLTSMSLLVPLFILISAVGFTAISKNPELQEQARQAFANAKASNPDIDIAFNKNGSADEEVSASSYETMAILFYILFVIVAIVVIVQLVAAVKLINATQLGIDAIGAAKRARFWRNCTIVFTVLCVLGCFKPSGLLEAGFNWLSILLRVIGIYIVHQFILELDVAARNGTGILPSHNGNVPMNTGMAYSYIPPQATHGQGPYPPKYDEVVKEKI